MKIALLDDLRELDSAHKSALKKAARVVLKEHRVPSQSELSITIINDPQMRELNRTYRNIGRTTDVLSFPQDEGPDFTLLGDVVISIDTARRQSDSYGVTLHEELKKLIIHGILHLLGYDHKKKKEAEIMREKERELTLLVRDL